MTTKEGVCVLREEDERRGNHKSSRGSVAD